MPEISEQPITLKELDVYVQKIVVPKIEEVVNQRMEHYTDKILTKEDTVIDKLDQILQGLSYECQKQKLPEKT